MTDRPTDHVTRSVTISRIYVRSTAMLPKNAYCIVAVILGNFMTQAMAIDSSHLVFYTFAVSTVVSMAVWRLGQLSNLVTDPYDSFNFISKLQQ